MTMTFYHGACRLVDIAGTTIAIWSYLISHWKSIINRVPVNLRTTDFQMTRYGDRAPGQQFQKLPLRRHALFPLWWFLWCTFEKWLKKRWRYSYLDTPWYSPGITRMEYICLYATRWISITWVSSIPNHTLQCSWTPLHQDDLCQLQSSCIRRYNCDDTNPDNDKIPTILWLWVISWLQFAKFAM